jgi:hypothetical protein
MAKPTPSKHIPGILIFIVGIFCTTTLTIGLTWANLEAAFYGFQQTGSDKHLGGLSCPRLMTPYETGTINVSFSNTTPQVLTPVIHIDISTPSVADSSEQQISIPPGKTGQVTLTVSSKNIDLDFFIFVKASTYDSYPLPTSEATCGTLILDVPFLGGDQIFGLWFGLGLLLMPLGLWLWNITSTPDNQKMQNAARALALVGLLGLLVAIQGQWLIELPILAITLLLAMVIIGIKLNAPS